MTTLPLSDRPAETVHESSKIPLTIAQLIEFDALCQRAAGRSDGTIALTTTALHRFQDFLEF